MSLWTCLDCLTRYAVGLSRCPHCLSNDYSEDELPKTNLSGPSDKDGAPSVGISSSTSSPNETSNSSTTQIASHKPAQNAENHSPSRRRKNQDASPSADSTAGNTPVTGSNPTSSEVRTSGGLKLPKPGVSNDG